MNVMQDTNPHESASWGVTIKKVNNIHMKRTVTIALIMGVLLMSSCNNSNKENKAGGETSVKRPGFQHTLYTPRHGTKANLKVGDLIEAGFSSNFGER